MENQTIVGIDVSSATLDICIAGKGEQNSIIIKNDVASIGKFLRPFKNECLIIGMENTGRYNWALYEVLADQGHQVFVIPPLHLKKSMGLVRGKNDKIDAIRIAAFTQKNHAELRQWKPASAAVQQLKILLTERNSRIKSKRQLVKQQTDYSKMKKLGLEKSLLKMNKQLADQLDVQIKIIEKRIEELIKSDEQLAKRATLIRSVPGAGKVLCWMILAKTENFTAITDPRKMACYSGVVPFDNQSGTSIKGKHRVSQYADKSIKTILHMAAMSAIRLKNDLREYYLRKLAEGKNKMSVLNAVRNKIVHRIFAVIKSQTPYQNHLTLS
jgi:transposase